jgi:DNA-binding XRE family transcriptional regulator
MKNILGTRILEYRESLGLTQDQFGAKYSVSGPAIFKFEKGYVKPSLELWLRIARDFGLNDRRAVLLWIKAKLPEKYQKFVVLTAGSVEEEEAGYGAALHGLDYSKFDDRDSLRESALKDDGVPRGLKGLLRDDDVWALFKPTGDEINLLRDLFGNLGEGSPDDYREALRLVRIFTTRSTL